MGRQTEESVILNLLDELQTDEIYSRNEAIKAIIKNKVNDPRIVDALIQITVHDSSKSVRNFARSALDKLGAKHSGFEKDEPIVAVHQEKEIRVDKPLEEGEDAKARKLEDAKNRTDFWGGFGFWFVLNIVILIVMSFLASFVTTLINREFVNAIGPVLLWLIPLAVNIGVMVHYGRSNRPQAVIGMLAAFGAMLTICLCLSAACFGM